MPVTKYPADVSDEDRPFVASRGLADGRVTLYYSDDELPPPVVAPAAIILTPRQFRQALTRAGIREAVESAIAGQDQDVRDWYQFADQYESTHPVVQATAQALGFSEAQLKAVFELGASL